MKKMYCLVVTDDYSRFTRVFFLATKDATSGILKSFITGIDNLVDHKVKVIRCSGPDCLFNIDALTRTMNYDPIVAGTQSNDFVGTKASDNAGQARKETEPIKYYKEDNVNSTNNVNVAGINEVNVVGTKKSIELLVDLNMPALEDYSIFDFSSDDQDDVVEADMNNLDTTIQVSPNLTIRIHKDHPLDQVIGDLQSATQTRKMSKNLKE
ncbi:hypothetical protein Tco_0569737 [Tanacetum coccineum]